MLLHGAEFPALQTRDIVEPDAKTKWATAPVTKYKLPLKWRKVYELVLPSRQFIAWSMCTISTKRTAVFDAHGKVIKYISCMTRTALVVTPQPLPLISEQSASPGILVACDSGENSWEKDNVTPYKQPPRDCPLQVGYENPVLSLVTLLASDDALPDTIFDVFGSSKGYGHVTALPFYAIDKAYIQALLLQP